MNSRNGLDFGTSTIFVASADGIVPIGDTWPWMPSLVGCVDDGSVIVGEHALEVDDSQLVRSIKRCITEGRTFVQLDTPVGVRDMRADDLMVEMLRESARRASDNGLDLASKGTMLGCPAMWDAPQRKRLHELARTAGLDVTLADLVDEPVAAGIAWLSERKKKAPKPERVVVFDMGGGTLDIAVLEVHGTDVSVLAALGVAEAGNALDKAIAEDLEYALAGMGTDIRMLEKPKRARARLQHAAPDVKVSLSSVAELDVKLPRREFGLASIPYGRAQLNEVFAPQMDRAEVYVATALRIALLPTVTDADSAHDIARAPLEELTGQVDVVVLSGGMSQIPYVTERLRAMFGDGPRIEPACVKPEEAVATGLARASGYSLTSKYRPAFDIVLEWDEGRQRRTVYEAYTPLLEMRQIAHGLADLRYICTGRQLALPDTGTGRLRVVSHSGQAVKATLNGSSLDGFTVALSDEDFEFSIYPNGRIQLSDAKGDYQGSLDGWQAAPAVPQQRGSGRAAASRPNRRS